MIAGDIWFCDELSGGCGRVLADFHDGGAFVEFVEHGDVDGVGSGVSVGAELFPEEAAAKSGDGVEGFGSVSGGGEIVPTEAWEGNGEEGDVACAAPCDVGFRGGGGVASGGFRGVEAADIPWADDVCGGGQGEEVRVGCGVAVEGAPEGGYAEHEGAAGVVFEEVDELAPLIEHGGAVIEAAAPEGDEWFIEVAEESRVSGGVG